MPATEEAAQEFFRWVTKSYGSEIAMACKNEIDEDLKRGIEVRPQSLVRALAQAMRALELSETTSTLPAAEDKN